MSARREFFMKGVLSVPTKTAGGTGGYTHSCGCVGPQNGQPLCPCKMRGVEIKNGRYVIPERDLGPVADFDDYRLGLADANKKATP